MSQNVGAIAPVVHFSQLGLCWQSYTDFQSIPVSIRNQQSRRLADLTGRGFMRVTVDPQLVADVEKHVSEASRLSILTDKNDNPVAYVCSDVDIWNQKSVYNLGGIIVEPTFQNQHLGFSIIRMELDQCKPDILILRTQNMSMYKLANKFAKLSNQLAAEMAVKYYPKNLDGVINHSVYRQGQSLYEDSIRFASQAIPFINWEAGDALVVAGFVNNEIQ